MPQFSGTLPILSMRGSCTFLLLGSIAAFMMSCGNNDNQAARNTRTIIAEAYQVQPEYYTVNIRSTANLLPYEEVEVKTPVSGNVMKIHFREGQLVRAGDLLVEIDNRSWVAQKKGLEARLISAEGEFRRKTKLLEIEGVSQEELDQSLAEVGNLKAQIESLNVMIDLAAIRAPFAGRLGMRNFSPGAFLSQGYVITKLVQTDNIRVHFSIPAKYAALAESGQEVRVVSSATGDTATAAIYAVDPMIDHASRSLALRALLRGNHSAFTPGDFAHVLFEVEQYENALLIPAESIIPELNGEVIFLVKNGTAVQREIQTSSRTEDRVQVIEGVVAGDTILTTGLMEVRDGDALDIRAVHQAEMQ
jgi:membrane fusion protein, multidrug efflux system